MRQGEKAEFSVRTESQSAAVIQWLRNGEPLPGANATTLSVGPATSADDGDSYSAVITSAQGETTSSSAFLTVTPGITVSLSANQMSDLRHYRGWPLVLELAVLHPEAFSYNRRLRTTMD